MERNEFNRNINNFNNVFNPNLRSKYLKRERIAGNIILYSFVFAFLSLFYFVGSHYTFSSSSIIDPYVGSYWIKILLLSVFEAAVLYALLLIIYIDLILGVHTNSIEKILFFSFLSVGLFLFNSPSVKLLNSLLDNSKTITRYARIINKSKYCIITSYKKGKTNKIHINIISISSWSQERNNSPLIFYTFGTNYSPNNSVVKLEINQGFFGIEYVTKWTALDSSLFPDDTKFPLTEEEGLKALEEKKELELKRTEEARRLNKPYKKTYKDL